MLEIRNLTKYYGDHLAVENLSFEIKKGDFVTLLGPSGCGKSTTLKSIAGLIEPTEGKVILRGDDVTPLPPEKRNIGMVFQDSALFPHMTVRENIEYGLKMHDITNNIDKRVDKYLNLVEMDGYGDDYPEELSGGQQRRISIARSLAYEPDMLLLDEPLTGLDRVLREQIRDEIKQIQRETNVTTLFVTHDQEEALSLSDKVIVLNDGKKEQEGHPRLLYEDPESQFVASFVGKSTSFTGTPSNDDPSIIHNGSLSLVASGDHDPNADNVNVYIRPEDIILAPDEKCTNRFSGTVQHISNVGSHSEVEVKLKNGKSILVESGRFPDVTVGDKVDVGFNEEDVIVL